MGVGPADHRRVLHVHLHCPRYLHLSLQPSYLHERHRHSDRERVHDHDFDLVDFYYVYGLRHLHIELNYDRDLRSFIDNDDHVRNLHSVDNFLSLLVGRNPRVSIPGRPGDSGHGRSPCVLPASQAGAQSQGPSSSALGRPSTAVRGYVTAREEANSRTACSCRHSTNSGFSFLNVAMASSAPMPLVRMR